MIERTKAAELDANFCRLYGPLTRLANDFIRKENDQYELQPGDLVHETYLRMSTFVRTRYNDETHFTRTAAGTMKRVLIDHARCRNAKKRNPDAIGDHRLEQQLKSSLNPRFASPEQNYAKFCDLLGELKSTHPRTARVFELRYFGELDVNDVAAQVNVSSATVKRDWARARCWLERRLADQI